MYKITHGLKPKKLIDIFQKTLLSQNYNLRSSTTKLYLAKPKTEYLKKGFTVVTEEQNCRMASRTSREIYNLSVNLIQAQFPNKSTQMTSQYPIYNMQYKVLPSLY